MKRFIVPLITFLPAVVVAMGLDIAFLGLMNDGAPAIEKRYARLVTEMLSSLENARVMDETKTARFRERIDFNSRPFISRELIRELEEYCTDSTIIIWGRIERCSVERERHRFIRQRLRGDISVKFIAYSLLQEKLGYTGTFDTTIHVAKGWAGFFPLLKIPVSAVDRTLLLHALQEVAAEKTVRELTLLISKKLVGTPMKQAREEEEPSISDIFSVPSVEAPSVDDEEPPANQPQMQEQSVPADVPDTEPEPAGEPQETVPQEDEAAGQ